MSKRTSPLLQFWTNLVWFLYEQKAHVLHKNPLNQIDLSQQYPYTLNPILCANELFILLKLFLWGFGMVRRFLQGVMLLVICTASIQGAVKKAPYLLFDGSNSAMTVMWQTTVSEGCTIKWGTTTSYEMGTTNTTEYGTDHQHKHKISGLTPGTL